MNCKPGDLAVVVKSYQGNEGKIVRCISLVDGIDWDHGGKCPTWKIEPPINNRMGHLGHYCADYQLRPLRDGEGDDETLQWAPVPVKENYHA